MATTVAMAFISPSLKPASFGGGSQGSEGALPVSGGGWMGSASALGAAAEEIPFVLPHGMAGRSKWVNAGDPTPTARRAGVSRVRAQGWAAAGPLLPANGPLLLLRGGLLSAWPLFCENLQIQPILGDSWETPWLWF